MLKNYHIQVEGKVQGVWFRKYTQEAAIDFSIVGIVKNDNDGSVYIEAEGSKKNLESFIGWLYKGSPLSKVEEVRWEEGPVVNYSQFEIIR